MVFVGCYEKERVGSLFTGNKVSVLQYEKNFTDWLHKNMHALNTTEPYT